MTRLPLVSLSFAVMTLFAVVPAVRADMVVDDEVTKFNGTITDVGVVRGPNQTGGVEYRIRGEFKSPVDIDLRNSTFTIEEFFVEMDRTPGAEDGAGELMRASQGPADIDPALAPLALKSNQGDSDDAKYETPGRFRPQTRVKVEKDAEKDGGFKFKFDVRLDRGMMRDRPNLCPGNPGTPPDLTPDADRKFRTPIRIGFTIAENETGKPLNEITVSTIKKWECPQPGRYHLRSR